MTLAQLFERAGRDVLGLTLLSLECGIYLLEIQTAEGRVLLRDAGGSVQRLGSVEHARDLLAGLSEMPFFLQHAEAHTEMCGLPGGAAEPLRTPISLRSSW